MPELPEVETVRLGLVPAMEGARFVKVEARRPDLRWPFPEDFVKRLEGKSVTGLGRRAKYLLVDLSSGEVLIMHLGMSGSFRVAKNGEEIMPGEFEHERSKAATHDHVVFHMSSGATVTFNDPRRFGFMKLVPRAQFDQEPLLRLIGPEPLGNEFGPALLARACRGKKTSLKAALSDQRVVAGLGNIYVCEALFRARLHPQAAAGSLVTAEGEPKASAHELAAIIRDVLNEAVEAGGSTLRDHAKVDGTLGYFQHRFRVYDREGEPCTTPACTGTVSRLVQSGRSTFYCPVCQQA
jgi:formamidopyrimidine-DNA glycosylase